MTVNDEPNDDLADGLIVSMARDGQIVVGASDNIDDGTAVNNEGGIEGAKKGNKLEETGRVVGDSEDGIVEGKLDGVIEGINEVLSEGD